MKHKIGDIITLGNGDEVIVEEASIENSCAGCYYLDKSCPKKSNGGYSCVKLKFSVIYKLHKSNCYCQTLKEISHENNELSYGGVQVKILEDYITLETASGVSDIEINYCPFCGRKLK